MAIFINSCTLLKKPFFIKNNKKEDRKEKREEKKLEKDIAKGKIDSTILIKKDSLLIFPTDTQLARNFLALRTIPYQTFQGKAKMHYESLEDKQNFTAYFRMKKDSIIWVSITAFEVEAARAIITKDSVKALDRINKNYYIYTYNDIQKIINLQVDFKTLQDLIIGNAVAVDGNITEVKNVQDFLTTFIKGTDYTNQITFNKADTSLRQIQLQTQREVSKSSLLISMSGFTRENNIYFSTLRDLNIQDIKGASTLTIDFKKFDFEKEIEFPFNVPSSFKLKITSPIQK
ncbi:MAG: DUF4292 domain-containing protein [Chitinophagaceae bacterium]|nr:DUF4292 domain-containing protein [Chitinophagaceae bacterium]